MKRSGLLVDYASSDDDERAAPTPPPPVKKRKLPPLTSQLVVPVPVDNPALHQGRVRSSPHVDGQYAAYVYVPLQIARDSALDTLLDKAVGRAKELVPILQPIGVPEDPDAKERELHISLTRPIYLRAHQREEFRTAVRTVCRKHKAFPSSFTNFAELTNDEQTRTFLTVEIGAGHRELETLCHELAPTLRSYRQKEFYDQPRFHASIAWALLSRASQEQSKPEATTAEDETHPLEQAPASTDSPTTLSSPAAPSSNSTTPFPTIPRFPDNLVSTLDEEFSAALRSKHVGTFDAEYLCVRIGKEVHRWKLQAV